MKRATIKTEEGVSETKRAVTETDATPAKRLKTSQTGLKTSQTGLKTGIPVIYQLVDNHNQTRVQASLPIILDPNRPISHQLKELLKDSIRMRLGFVIPPTVLAVLQDGGCIYIGDSVKSIDLLQAVTTFIVRDDDVRVIETRISYAAIETELLSINPITMIVPAKLTQLSLAVCFLEKLFRPLTVYPDPHCRMQVRIGIVTKNISEKETCENVTALEVVDERRARGAFPIRVQALTAAGTVDGYITGHSGFTFLELATQILEQPLYGSQTWVEDFSMEISGATIPLTTPLKGYHWKLGQVLGIRATSHCPIWVSQNGGFVLLLLHKASLESRAKTLEEFESRYWISSGKRFPWIAVSERDEQPGPKTGECYIATPPGARSILLFNGTRHAMYFEDQVDAHYFNPRLYTEERHSATGLHFLRNPDFRPTDAFTFPLP